jgi:hypothetical protein
MRIQMKRRAWAVAIVATTFSRVALAQIPDLLNSFDPGSKSTSAGGALHTTESSTLSTYYNPAGIAYMDRREVGVSYRNLPKSTSVVGNTYNDIVRSTTGEGGKSTITHLGYVLPAKAWFRNLPGTLGFSYTVGGYIDDTGAVANGSSLPVGAGLAIKGYADHTYAKSDFFTAAYARTNGPGNVAYGLGLVLLNQHLRYSQSGTYVDGQGQAINPQFTLPNQSSDGFGLGLIAGAIYSPLGNPNLSFGISYRTPFNLMGNSDTANLYDRVPGRFLLGAAYRTGGIRRGKDDFAVFGLEYQSYTATSNSSIFDRSGQTIVGLGVEYSYALGSARVPLRLGSQSLGSGGSDYIGRSSYTYGFGYHSGDGLYGVDFNWARIQNGGTDLSITANYRFK